MALGTITVVSKGASVGPIFHDYITVVGEASYTTGGAPGFQTALRAKFGDKREVMSVNDDATGTYRAEYDKANDKLMVFVRATGVEVAGAVNLSGVTHKLHVISK